MASSRRPGKRRRDAGLLQLAGAMHGERAAVAWRGGRRARWWSKAGRSPRGGRRAPAEQRGKPASTWAERCGGRRGEQVSGECAGERLDLDAVETSVFSPTEFLSFPGASIQERTSFLNQETVSSNLPLFPHLFTCHVTFYAYVAPYLIEIETTINTHWDCPKPCSDTWGFD
jgi:hypothetical protein